MSERERACFESVMVHIAAIKRRFNKIISVEDFIKSEEGETMLDAIAIRLQAIGENIKKLDKISPAILNTHSEIEWNKIILFRNLISHHYELLNHEIIFSICKNDIPKLEIIIQKILNEGI